VVELMLPPLRERGAADIVRLAHHFVALAAKRHGRPVPSFEEAALARLVAYRWPGNVRELENCIESAIIVMEGQRIGEADLPLPSRPLALGATPASEGPASSSSGEHAPLTLDEVERRHLAHVLAQTDHNQTVAARLLGIGRNTLARKMRKYGL
jgi:Nif-specific regulatory protein